MDLNQAKTFQPTGVSRRSEYTAWALAGVLLVSLTIVWNGPKAVALGTGALLGLFLFGALGMSLSNWMDRRTRLILDRVGIGFTNGLRNIHLEWHEIIGVRVFPARWGAKRVQVIAPDSHFEFQTRGILRYRGEVQGETGFRDGEEIQNTIVDRSGLRIMTEQDASRVYYSRE